MFKFILSYLISIVKPIDVTLTINGCHFTFSKEGDIRIIASRNLIENGKYIFTNCSNEQIEYILYSKESECFQQLEEETL